MSTGTTIAFPHSLREDIEAGTANHISFQIIGAGLDENVFKIVNLQDLMNIYKK